MLSEGKVGQRFLADGAQAESRLDRTGALVVTEGHARFQEAVYRGNVYSIATGQGTSTITNALVALNANTIGLAATAVPIVGLWNPLTSTVNIVIMRCVLTACANTVTTPVPPGAFVWAGITGQSAISTGNIPMNRKTLQQAGSQCKGFNLSPALTGLVGTMGILDTADFTNAGPVTYGTVANTSIIPSIGGAQDFEGSLIIPPGGVLALLNTISTTTFSASARLMWEEVPL